MRFLLIYAVMLAFVLLIDHDNVGESAGGTFIAAIIVWFFIVLAPDLINNYDRSEPREPAEEDP